MKAIKETKKLVREYDKDAKWYPIIALEFIAGIAIWCYMALTCGPVL